MLETQNLSKERELLTVKEVARLVDYSESALNNWRSQGIGPRYLKLSTRRVRYRRSDILAWLDSAERGGTQDRAPGPETDGGAE